MRRGFTIARAFCAALVLLLSGATGCGVIYHHMSTQRMTETHFVFPNSNIQPIGSKPVVGKAEKVCGILILHWGSLDQELEDEAMADALKKANADLLINADLHRSDASFTLLGLPVISLCGVSVGGTPVKMTVGKQDLR